MNVAGGRSAIRELLSELRAAAVRDGRNLAAHGRRAPRWAERVWVDPRAITTLCAGAFGRSWTGRVVDDEQWSAASFSPVDDMPKVVACRRHWVDGEPWEATGVIDFVVGLIDDAGRAVDGCRTRDDVVRRYAALDDVHAAVGRERRLRTRAELPGHSFRERGGVYVHVGPDGDIVFAGGGTHRLAIARLHGLASIPAQLGVVHRDALDALVELRRRRPVRRALGGVRGFEGPGAVEVP